MLDKEATSNYMKCVTFFFLCLAFTINLSAQNNNNNDYPFKEKYSFEGSNCYLNSDIEIDDVSLRTGNLYSVKYTINVGTFCQLYNPFFNSLIDSPGQVALYDENKKYISNLTRKLGGSSARISEASWENINGGSSVESQKIFIVRKNFVDNPDSLLMEEGTYYLQLIFYKRIVSSPPDFLDLEIDLSNFYKTFSTEELFRSNAIKINIVKAK